MDRQEQQQQIHELMLADAWDTYCRRHGNE